MVVPVGDPVVDHEDHEGVLCRRCLGRDHWGVHHCSPSHCAVEHARDVAMFRGSCCCPHVMWSGAANGKVTTQVWRG